MTPFCHQWVESIADSRRGLPRQVSIDDARQDAVPYPLLSGNTTSRRMVVPCRVNGCMRAYQLHLHEDINIEVNSAGTLDGVQAHNVGLVRVVMQFPPEDVTWDVDFDECQVFRDEIPPGAVWEVVVVAKVSDNNLVNIFCSLLRKAARSRPCCPAPSFRVPISRLPRICPRRSDRPRRLTSTSSPA